MDFVPVFCVLDAFAIFDEQFLSFSLLFSKTNYHKNFFEQPKLKIDDSDLPDDPEAAKKVVARLEREAREKKEMDLIDKIRIVLQKGAKLNFADSNGFTPLHLLAMLGNTGRVLKW